MDKQFLIELYGYLGSTLVVVSMLMASVVKLRVINTVGSIISGTYALIIGSFPLALMNICLIVINVYNLYKLLKTEQDFDMVSVGSGADGTVAYFLRHYQTDIAAFFPDFDGSAAADAVYLVCCGGSFAGILVGMDLGDGVIDVQLDYSVPAYRDCSVGKYLYGKLAEQGVKELRFSQSRSDSHGAYLQKMGFVQERGVYVKHLG